MIKYLNVSIYFLAIYYYFYEINVTILRNVICEANKYIFISVKTFAKQKY